MKLSPKPGRPVLVLYDISSDRVRTRVSEACKDYGLKRVQNSAFLGRLTRAAREELEMRLEREFGKASGVVQVIGIEIEALEASWFKGNP